MNQSNESFSVVIPTYNHADFLRDALQSVINQNHSLWEAIVIDNHSSDHTDQVIKSFNDPRITVHKINNNGVIGASRNLGIKLANYDWIAFLDSDDIWYPEKLSEVCKFLSTNTKYDVISTDEFKVFHHNEKKKLLYYGPLPKDAYKFMLCYGNRLSPSATVVKKSLLIDHNIYFNESIDFITVEDYDFWLNLAFARARFKFIPSIQGEYLVHLSNNSGREDIHSKNNEYLLWHHVFNIQTFTKDKEKLWNKIMCRIEIHKALSLLSKKRFLQSFNLIIRIFISSPINFVLYFIQRLSIYLRKYFSYITYKLSEFI
jgi:glycosyltransferase involved in cell wall biosynthesis